MKRGYADSEYRFASKQIRLAGIVDGKILFFRRNKEYEFKIEPSKVIAHEDGTYSYLLRDKALKWIFYFNKNHHMIQVLQIRNKFEYRTFLN